MSASRPGGGQHLDATAGREVVFCHACSYEWYRDEQGLECPRCRSEITEVVDPSEDPRDHSRPVPNLDDLPSSASTSPERHRHQDEDSDPEEADIEEHLGPHGFTYRRATFSGPDHDHLHHHHHQPGFEQDHSDRNRQSPPVDPVLQRFADMLQGLSNPSRAGGPMNFGGNRHTTFQRTTFTSRTTGGGTASVTIFSGPALHHARAGHDDPFQDFFNSTMRDMGPPPVAQGQANNEQGPPAGFAQSLQEILNLFNPANAAVGDAVYSQEALDRIITNLMEQNPQSNAAPPASEQALEKLERKKVTADLLGEDGHTECAICIDSFEEGQTATFLPCKHWFHDECVVLWLKEHNTCPVCRTPIETREEHNANQSGSGGNGSGSGNRGLGDSSSSGDQAGPESSQAQPGSTDPNTGSRSNHGFMSFATGSYPPPQQRPETRVMFYRFGTGNVPARPAPLTRPPSQSQTPLNQVMRDISSSQREQERTRAREAATDQSYDTSRFQHRRTSMSPTAPRSYTPAEHGARMRQRSPSSSERRRTPPESESNNRNSSNGPLGWLRDRFGGSQRDGRGS
ncbi:hypothetical protein NLU13_4895 [Sarocladium strictum]|uniref:RING-type E3 ubiquitin transferase n=1 Tax=Sarocladium strictum TaxID=5046 RepID=A0AA39L940_SARSR|nr:hypothetical protein NLU13_4895 [Sarocladium strictum]